jgi:hypothetical protein
MLIPMIALLIKKPQAIIDECGPSKVLLGVQSLLDVNGDVSSSSQTSSLTDSITSATDLSKYFPMRILMKWNVLIVTNLSHNQNLTTIASSGPYATS